MRILEIINKNFNYSFANISEAEILSFPYNQIRIRAKQQRLERIEKEIENEYNEIRSKCFADLENFSFDQHISGLSSIGGFKNINGFLELFKIDPKMPDNGIYGLSWQRWYADLKDDNPEVFDRINNYVKVDRLAEAIKRVMSCIDDLVKFKNKYSNNPVFQSLIEDKVLTLDENIEHLRWWAGTLTALMMTLEWAKNNENLNESKKLDSLSKEQLEFRYGSGIDNLTIDDLKNKTCTRIQYAISQIRKKRTLKDIADEIYLETSISDDPSTSEKTLFVQLSRLRSQLKPLVQKGIITNSDLQKYVPSIKEYNPQSKIQTKYFDYFQNQPNLRQAVDNLKMQGHQLTIVNQYLYRWKLYQSLLPQFKLGKTAKEIILDNPGLSKKYQVIKGLYRYYHFNKD